MYIMSREMIFIRSIGFIGGLCTTFSFSPQVVHLWKSNYIHEIDGLSLGMYGIYTVGTWLWIIYGILVRDSMIVLFNALSSLLVLYCLYKIVKLRNPEFYKNRKPMIGHERYDSSSSTEDGDDNISQTMSPNHDNNI